MTDRELVELIDRTPIEELTVEQCTAVRSAAATSVEVRRACLERIGLEERLAATLGAPRMSVEDLLDGVRRDEGPQGHGRWLAIALLALLALGLAAGALVAPWWRGSVDVAVRDGDPRGAAATTVENARTPDGDAEAVSVAAGEATPPSESPTAGTAPAQADPATNGDVGSSGGAQSPAVAAVAAAEPPPADATGAAGDIKKPVEQPPPPPPPPWAAALADDAAAPSPSGLFALLPPRVIPDAEMRSWFVSARQDKPLEFGRKNIPYYPHPLATVTGEARLVPPLRPGTALRLHCELPYIKIRARSGRTEAVIDTVGQPQNWRWYGSVVTRAEDGDAIESRWLAHTSDARPLRTNLPSPGVIELRATDDSLVVSRGEVRLVEVPLPAPPDEVVFEGTLALVGIELVRAVDPPALPTPPAETTAWRPADLQWEAPGAAALEKQPDGSVRLAQREEQPKEQANEQPKEPPKEQPKEPLTAMLRLPPAEAGPRDILLRISDYTLGSGICFGDAGGVPRIAYGFVEFAEQWAPPGPRGPLLAGPFNVGAYPSQGGNPGNREEAFMPPSLWLRLRIVNNGGVALSWSGDGRHWVRSRGYVAVPGGCGSIGLYVAAQPGGRITLQQIAAAELPGFAKVLPRDLVAAVNPTLAGDATTPFEAWKQTTLAAKPADVDTDRWLLASAIRCLATNRTSLDRDLSAVVWSHVRTSDMPLDDKIAVCDDVNRILCLTSKGDCAVASGIYGVLARQCVDRGDLAGYRRVWLAMLQAPSDVVQYVNYQFQVDPLGVSLPMLRRLVMFGRPEDLRDQVVRDRFYENGVGPASSLASKVADGRASVSITSADRLHDTTKGLADAVAAGDWAEAYRVFTVFADSVAPADAFQRLAVHPRDPDRAVTIPTLFTEAVRDHAGLREYLQGEPAARGRLRLLQAISTGDETEVLATALEFLGTPAAGEACEWLAMRWLAQGRFSAALDMVEDGAAFAAADVRERLLTIRAVAQALGGTPPTAPPWASVGGIAAPDLLAFVASVPPVAAEVPPGPSALAATKRLDLGPVAYDPNNNNIRYVYPQSLGAPLPKDWLPTFEPPLFATRLDWGAEICSLATAPGRLLVGNRLELASVDPATGAQQWRLAAPAAPGTMAHAGLQAMRPACDSRHAYVRRSGAQANMLAAIRLADGSIAWETPLPAWSSDPVLVEGGLRFVEVAMPMDLVLVGVNPDTGARQFERSLGCSLPNWPVVFSPGYPNDCQLANAGGRLIATTSGGVFCCTADGRVCWVRTQPWMSPQIDGWWSYQRQEPPIVHGDTVFVAQPGVDGVAAIDLGNGRLRWRLPLPRVRRLIGIAGSGAAARLVVEMQEGIVSVEPGTGKPKRIFAAKDSPGDPWLGIAPTRLLGPALATPAGQVIVAVQGRPSGPPPGDALPVVIEWIDATSGAVIRTTDVPALAGKPPWVGPLTAAGGRLWLLSQTDMRDVRRSLWELAPQPAP